MTSNRPRDRFIEKVGCFLIAIPVGALIVTATAQELNIPPVGVFLGAALVAVITGGFGSGSRTTSQPPPISRTFSDHRPGPRRGAYEHMREIVERYENGEISAEQRDRMVREIRR